MNTRTSRGESSWPNTPTSRISADDADFPVAAVQHLLIHCPTRGGIESPVAMNFVPARVNCEERSSIA